MTVQQAYIVAAKRTPIGKAPRGVFSSYRPDELLAEAIRGMLADVPKLDPAAIEEVVAGCALPEGPQGFNVARISALLAGLPHTVAGMTVNRFCASGLEAVNMAANQVRGGAGMAYVAGGVECMSRVPMGTDGGAIAVDPQIAIDNYFVPQGISADIIACPEGKLPDTSFTSCGTISGRPRSMNVLISSDTITPSSDDATTAVAVRRCPLSIR